MRVRFEGTLFLIKKIFFLIICFIMFLTLNANAEPAKVMSLSYDDSSSLVFLNVESGTDGVTFPQKYVRLENPNRIYFDVNNAVLIGSKQQLVFEKSDIKEIRVAQFSTEPNTVRVVVTFEEGFDTSKIKLVNINGNVVLKVSGLNLKNDYFNPVYDENPESKEYSSIVANSQVVQKVAIPNPAEQGDNKTPASVVDDIYKAFASSTLNNSDGKTYDTVISVDLSSNLKLRTKYYINGYYFKTGGLLVSGTGQMTTAKMFTLDNPKRVVIDLPNSYVDRKIRNKEISLCSDGSCKDTAKIGQFEFNKARIVVTADKPEKYIPIYSPDGQSMLFINADKLNHTTLVSNVSNLNKAYVKKINSKTGELIFTFTTPVVHSIVRGNNELSLFLFNVKSYNEPDLIKTLNNTMYKNMTLSLLPQIGVKTNMKISKDDIVQVAQSLDGKALRIMITQSNTKKTEPVISPSENKDKAKSAIKNKVVLDPGHGGTDYGAIREGINEKDITLDVSQRVASILKSKGYKVAMTRNEDVYVSLEDRVNFSEKENPEIFVSIHVNSAVATEPFGIETHYYHEYSKELSEVIQAHLMKEIESKDRGIIKSKFYVINHTTVPAVLVEMGFLSNPDERAKIITDIRKQKTAKAIADGIIEYLKKKK